MNKIIIATIPTILLASCATTPTTPLEAYLNRYAGAESVITYCPAYGGYSSVTAMTNDARQNLAQAQALGATQKDIAQARARVGGTFVAIAALTSPLDACSSMINNLAMAGTTAPAIASKPKPSS
jgi:hypothetical protein